MMISKYTILATKHKQFHIHFNYKNFLTIFLSNSNFFCSVLLFIYFIFLLQNENKAFPSFIINASTFSVLVFNSHSQGWQKKKQKQEIINAYEW